MTILDRLNDAAAALTDAAVQTTEELLQKGREQARLLNLEHQLSRAQRQLGALVYALHKNHTDNAPLVARYLEAIAGLEEEIEACRAARTEGAEAAETYCPQCGAQVDPDALFCPACGGSL